LSPHRTVSSVIVEEIELVPDNDSDSESAAESAESAAGIDEVDLDVITLESTYESSSTLKDDDVDDEEGPRRSSSISVISLGSQSPGTQDDEEDSWTYLYGQN
jgi:hypothetical protein